MHQSDLPGPSPVDLAQLSPMERAAFRLVRRMNRGRFQSFWFRCQKQIGARWIDLATRNLLHVYGLEHVEAASRSRSLLLVANHRSFFDLYVALSPILRRTQGWRGILFPVRGRFFYQSPLGLLVNFLAAWWAMYPPFFFTPAKRGFDRAAFAELTELCRTSKGTLIGYHPEGHRNPSADPYSFLPAQPGIGRLIKEAAPQVLPVFVAGLGNNLLGQIKNNWAGGEPIRVHFGPVLDLGALLSRPNSPRAYREITDLVMSRIAQLGEQDRKLWGSDV